MMKNYRQQLKKGIMATVILKIIANKTTYGYEIIKALRQYQTLVTKEGSLYPILYRLEDEGLITSDWVLSDNSKKPRKFYTITAEGRTQLKQVSAEWQLFASEVSAVLQDGSEQNG
jgi:PadR family transcriptional regulator PadR